MSLSENGNGGLSAADVAAVVDGRGYPYAVPMMGAYGGGFGSGLGYGGDATWLIIRFLFAMMGGWGNGFGGGFGSGSGQFPWMLANNTDNLVTGGFNQATTTSLLGDIQGAITSGFASAEVADCNRAMNAMQTAYTNQIADMNQRFSLATEVDDRLDTLAMSLQKCCCDNELATESLRYTIATENAADRASVSDGIRDILTATQAQTQRILDQMCQDKIDAKDETIANLRTQLNMAGLQASQTAQTAALVADNTAQTQALIQRIAPYPVPSYQVANPWSYGYGYGGGCCGGFGGFNGNF